MCLRCCNKEQESIVMLHQRNLESGAGCARHFQIPRFATGFRKNEQVLLGAVLGFVAGIGRDKPTTARKPKPFGIRMWQALIGYGLASLVGNGNVREKLNTEL
jgi:hypothetical protein